MKKIMISITAVSAALCSAFLTAYCFTGISALETVWITFLIVFYHFAVRLIVGAIVNRIFHNKFDYENAWFKVRKWENGLHKFLKVKSWKKLYPTYKKDSFDITKHSLEEIAGAMCQAEAVHEIIVLLSFLPIVCAIWWNPLWVFIVTSAAAAIPDTISIIIQRYNRPRIVRLIKIYKDRNKNNPL